MTASREDALPGREAERELFTRCLREAAQGLPRLLIFEGEAGVGRSALLAEIEGAPQLRAGRIRVVRLDVHDGNEDPVLLLARAVARYGIYERLGGRRRIGGAAGRLLPQWLGAIPGVGDVLEAIAETAAILRKRSRGEQGTPLPEDVESLIRVARRRPLAILIDDLHRCDEHVLDRLRQLITEAETGVRLLVVGTARTPAVGAPAAPVHRLDRYIGGGRLVRHRLQPFDIEAVAERIETPELPEAVLSALRVAASLTEEFDALDVAERTGRDELAIEDTLAIAVRAGALVSLGMADRPDGDISTRYRFTSPALRAHLGRSDAHAGSTDALAKGG